MTPFSPLLSLTAGPFIPFSLLRSLFSFPRKTGSDAPLPLLFRCNPSPPSFSFRWLPDPTSALLSLFSPSWRRKWGTSITRFRRSRSRVQSRRLSEKPISLPRESLTCARFSPAQCDLRALRAYPLTGAWPYPSPSLLPCASLPGISIPLSLSWAGFCFPIAHVLRPLLDFLSLLALSSELLRIRNPKLNFGFLERVL